MLYEEFTKRTNIYPPMDLFEVIHEVYCEHNEMDKDQFCESYKENKDYLAESITRRYNEKKWNREQEQAKKLRDAENRADELEKSRNEYKTAYNDMHDRYLEEVGTAEELQEEIRNLKKYIEKIQGWETIESKYNEPEDDIITDDQAKDILNRYVLNIDISSVEILHETPVYQKDRYGNVRKSDKVQDVRPWAYEDEAKFCIAFSYCGTEYSYTYIEDEYEKVQPLHHIEFELG